VISSSESIDMAAVRDGERGRTQLHDPLLSSDESDEPNINLILPVVLRIVQTLINDYYIVMRESY
jgi:hypothetical protein